jgi:hypothetical protein
LGRRVSARAWAYGAAGREEEEEVAFDVGAEGWKVWEAACAGCETVKEDVKVVFGSNIVVVLVAVGIALGIVALLVVVGTAFAAVADIEVRRASLEADEKPGNTGQYPVATPMPVPCPILVSEFKLKPSRGAVVLLDGPIVVELEACVLLGAEVEIGSR